MKDIVSHKEICFNLRIVWICKEEVLPAEFVLLGMKQCLSQVLLPLTQSPL